MSLNRLAPALEATRLGFGLTDADAAQLARRAVALGVGGVCLPVTLLRPAATIVHDAAGHRPDLVTVANFPTGDHPLRNVLADAERAGRWGAEHLDVVVPGRLVRMGEWAELTRFVRAVRDAARQSAGRPVRLKAILETAALTEREILGAGNAAIEGGADWLKTSTGFHPGGGATVDVVRVLRAIAPEEVGIKAAGGIRTRAQALAMLEAGADRIGTSAEEVILG